MDVFLVKIPKKANLNFDNTITTLGYDPDSEICIKWDDPYLDIEWPLKSEPILSVKDQLGIPVKMFKI